MKYVKIICHFWRFGDAISATLEFEDFLKFKGNFDGSGENGYKADFDDGNFFKQEVYRLNKKNIIDPDYIFIDHPCEDEIYAEEGIETIVDAYGNDITAAKKAEWAAEAAEEILRGEREAATKAEEEAANAAYIAKKPWEAAFKAFKKAKAEHPKTKGQCGYIVTALFKAGLLDGVAVQYGNTPDGICNVVYIEAYDLNNKVVDWAW